MAKLYFKYGAMGSSKTAQALITKYNYEENDLNVWLIKPSADTRDGVNILRSRIGLEAQVHVVTPAMDVYDLFVTAKRDCCDVIIVDECQFILPQTTSMLPLRNLGPRVSSSLYIVTGIEKQLWIICINNNLIKKTTQTTCAAINSLPRQRYLVPSSGWWYSG